MLWLILIAVSMWVLQCVLGVWQFNQFNKEFKALRREGRVAIGKAKGKLVAGAVVLLCLDREDRIIIGKKMQGLTIFARVKEFTPLNGLHLLDVHEDVLRGLDRQTAKAVLDAVKNYQEFTAQEAGKREVLISANSAAN